MSIDLDMTLPLIYNKIPLLFPVGQLQLLTHIKEQTLLGVFHINCHRAGSPPSSILIHLLHLNARLLFSLVGFTFLPSPHHSLPVGSLKPLFLLFEV